MALVVAVGMIMSIVAGCINVPEAPIEAPGLTGTLVIAGSTSVAPIAEELARAFEAIHPEVRIDVHSTALWR
ncbi:MAG: hypothetical protein BME93_03885 [Methanosarcinales archaeon Met12]|nr:MAG: hypothetical protein BME93_03885 [Methanosarcinales archaeon Met12]